ncbi:MAG: ATP-binding protein [Bradyrhizobium sp.]|nr:ATP-binding protein [Bradyrhizobium sp.]
MLVDVIDDGKGMSKEDAAHIFERFYRADTSRTRDTGGSGLGLAIVHSLVEQHDGSISVDSELGRGTTFTVRLPALADARAIGALTFALRTATDLAAHWTATDRENSAVQLLAPILGEFTEGFGTQDLVRASRFLAEIEERTSGRAS